MQEIKTICPSVHPSLTHLSIDQIASLQEDFIKGELKNKEIIAKYQLIGISPNALTCRMPPYIDKSIACPECNVFSIRRLSGRGMPAGEPYCPSCGQSLLSKFDPEKRIWELRNLKQLVKMDPKAAKQYRINYERAFISRINFDGLTFSQKVFLGSWVSTCISEDLTTILGHEVLEKKICPTKEYFDDMINSLADEGLLPSNEIWNLKIEIEPDLVKEILFPKVFQWADLEDQLIMWKEIAYQEILEFYDYKMSDIKLGYTIGEKAYLIINSMVDTYSVSQSWNLVYYAVKDACEFLVKNGNKPHASNTVLYNCSKRMERYLQNNWVLTPFKRWSKYCAQSEISIYFFQKILMIGDNGFNLKPSYDALVEDKTLEELL